MHILRRKKDSYLSWYIASASRGDDEYYCRGDQQRGPHSLARNEQMFSKIFARVVSKVRFVTVLAMAMVNPVYEDGPLYAKFTIDDSASEAATLLTNVQVIGKVSRRFNAETKPAYIVIWGKEVGPSDLCPQKLQIQRYPRWFPADIARWNDVVETAMRPA
jgi:hypothetical protein